MASTRCNITVVAMLGNDLAPTSHSDVNYDVNYFARTCEWFSFARICDFYVPPMSENSAVIFRWGWAPDMSTDAEIGGSASVC
jgi:hypothetical protein